MLMSPDDSGIDHHVFVVGIARQQLENAFKDAALRPPAEALVDDLPVAEAGRQITPRDSGSVSIKNRIDKQPIVRRSATDMTRATWQKVLDPIPLVVAQSKALHDRPSSKADHR